MSLMPRCPVQNPCSAETFEEAYRKNAARYAFERQEAASLYREMLAKKDPLAESVNPDFWTGCEAANREAWEILNAELKEAAKRASERIRAMTSDVKGPQLVGYREVRDKWAEEVLKNDPTAIVYW